MSARDFGYMPPHTGPYNSITPDSRPNQYQDLQSIYGYPVPPSQSAIASQIPHPPRLPTGSWTSTTGLTQGSQPPHTFASGSQNADRSYVSAPLLDYSASPLPLREMPKEKNIPKKVQDRIIPPSKESGGVPDPTSAYLKLAGYPPLRLPNARKVLVVIDLNGTLLYRPNKRNPTGFIARPYAKTFLTYCLDTFVVAIWSSARPDNVARMLEVLLTPEQRGRVVAVWGRDRFGLSPKDYALRVQCYKRLSALWEDPDVARAHPEAAKGGRWTQEDTVLVDDSMEKARTEPYNLIGLPEFVGETAEPGYILPQVHDYINECSRQLNVSAYMREVPFRINPEFALKDARPQT